MKEKNEHIYEAGFEDGFRAASESKQPLEARNQTAFVLGAIAGLFGVWGLSHVLNNKVGSGCLWMLIIGPVLAGILGGAIVATGGLGAVVVVPLWLYIVYAQAKSGASNFN